MRTRWGGALLFLTAIWMTSTAQAAPVTVKVANSRMIKTAVAAQKGHVVVVNFWATWCGPCMAEYPHLVTFANQYKTKGVVVMAVSGDSKKDLTAKVTPFLTKQHTNFPAFLLYSREPDDFINAFDPSWDGNFPRTFIYDKRGKLVKSLGEGQTVKSLTAAVKPFL